MNTIQKAIDLLRNNHGMPAEIGQAWIVADELEALLKQEPVCELREDGKIKFLCWSSEVPASGAKLYTGQQVAPEGWQLVPVKITDAMDDVYKNRYCVYQTGQQMHDAMLAAAP